MIGIAHANFVTTPNESTFVISYVDAYGTVSQVSQVNDNTTLRASFVEEMQGAANTPNVPKAPNKAKKIKRDVLAEYQTLIKGGVAVKNALKAVIKTAWDVKALAKGLPNFTALMQSMGLVKSRISETLWTNYSFETIVARFFNDKLSVCPVCGCLTIKRKHDTCCSHECRHVLLQRRESEVEELTDMFLSDPDFYQKCKEAFAPKIRK